MKVKNLSEIAGLGIKEVYVEVSLIINGLPEVAKFF